MKVCSKCGKNDFSCLVEISGLDAHFNEDGLLKVERQVDPNEQRVLRLRCQQCNSRQSSLLEPGGWDWTDEKEENV